MWKNIKIQWELSRPEGPKKKFNNKVLNNVIEEHVLKLIRNINRVN